MKFSIAHCNINVFDLEKSLKFYKEALGLVEVRRKEASDGSFVLAFLGDETSHFRIELTWMRDRQTPYNLGDNESHIAFVVDDYEAAHALHTRLGCICYENTAMGLYFIEDPDGYWLEVLPSKR
ncbi:MAG: Lactoylglutathione lyase [Firmicutes bacterium]|nr:Lactoylglutathione lyase [candidate division NPL-UPA2 bacterium]MBT9155941.1 Lactoylglutathione lyase [candidate division NPL-UPA2 bacterium]